MGYLEEYSQKFLSVFTTVIAIYAIFWWCTDHITSVFEFFVNSFSTCFRNQASQSLQEKYGQWAGKWVD